MLRWVWVVISIFVRKPFIIKTQNARKTRKLITEIKGYLNRATTIGLYFHSRKDRPLFPLSKRSAFISTHEKIGLYFHSWKDRPLFPLTKRSATISTSRKHSPLSQKGVKKLSSQMKVLLILSVKISARDRNKPCNVRVLVLKRTYNQSQDFDICFGPSQSSRKSIKQGPLSSH